MNTLVIHHKSKYNAFALANDIMEPFRPIVNEKVFEIMQRFDKQQLNTVIPDSFRAVISFISIFMFVKIRENVVKSGVFADQDENLWSNKNLCINSS